MRAPSLTQAVVEGRLGPVTFAPGPGITAVLGPNGAGKSTLIRALHGMTRLDAGTWTPGPMTRALLPQAPAMLRRSVAGNLAYPLRLAGRSRAEATGIARARAQGLDLDPDRPAEGLSGGERARLAIARTLIAAPDLALLDEPCAHLDGPSTRAVEAMLRQARSDGMRLILVTHDRGAARRLADDALFVLGGCIVERGPHIPATPNTPQARAWADGEIV
ncbi:MAG: ATP-binding cassette domain-containing protein [Paracoccaceae bacterium]